MTAVVVRSMALTPLAVIAHRRWGPKPTASLEGAQAPEGLVGNVLIIGFGRFGQIASQHVLAMGADISIIDHEPQVGRDAEDFGFKVYYGDGTRADVLHAAGAHHARAILVCVDDRQAATRIVEHGKAEFPHARLLARAHDREHAIELIKAGVDYQVRVTFESAMALGCEAARVLGATPEASQDACRRCAPQRRRAAGHGGVRRHLCRQDSDSRQRRTEGLMPWMHYLLVAESRRAHRAIHHQLQEFTQGTGA